jgi:hypothetical protein
MKLLTTIPALNEEESIDSIISRSIEARNFPGATQDLLGVPADPAVRKVFPVLGELRTEDRRSQSSQGTARGD